MNCSNTSSRLNARVIQTIFFASAIRSAYHCNVALLFSSSRALNKGVTLFFGGFPGGVGEAARFRGRNFVDVRFWESRTQYSRYVLATDLSHTIWPTLE